MCPGRDFRLPAVAATAPRDNMPDCRRRGAVFRRQGKGGQGQGRPPPYFSGAAERRQA
jgi:hypothetical protein